MSQPGFFLWVSEGKSQLNFSAKNNEKKFCLLTQNSAKIFVQKDAKFLKVFLQAEGQDGFSLCGETESSSFFSEREQLFFYMAARSSRRSKIALHVSQVIVNTDEMNPDIDQYNST